MALTLGGPIVSANGRNEILDQIAAKLETLVSPAGLRVVYPYRTTHTETVASAAVSFWSGTDTATPDLEKSYTYLIHILVSKKKGDVTDEEAAERLLNKLMEDVWRVLRGPNRPYWSDCYPAAEDNTPTSTPDLINFRRGFMYVRVKPL